MDQQLISTLNRFVGKSLVVRTEPEVIDFTVDRPAHLVISDEDRLIRIPLSSDLKRFRETMGCFQELLENPDILLIGWNLKSFLSYHRYRVGKDFKPKGALLDLRVMERYFGMDKKCPEYLNEAKVRLSVVAGMPKWAKLKEIYGKIYIPLISEIVPQMETIGIIHQEKRQKLHACYDIAGQVHGRMKCTNFVNGYNPHTLSEEDKSQLRPPNYEETFISLDFKHMEVSVLQWLTGDEYLAELLNGEDDVYETIWKSVTGISGSGHRQHGKDIFLPVVYGMGSQTLGEKLGIKEESASKLINKVYTKFRKSFEWVKRQQDNTIDGICHDAFGRRHQVDEKYKIRNFIVQSPAALICLDKLVKLHKALEGLARIGMHVHDGYVIFANRENFFKVAKIAKGVLEAEDELYPGLLLKSSCQTGEKLNEVK
jgi:hypothetical protein